ncbi:TIGR02281 family clan AA aspartic protease [uncultured Paraglaciecola sp.]|uniref:retropepsin-like aspartic protease family protein n=1 Tax=uncultured Paraglaciecola sp. TaxID=1765024 RepID=UPI002634E816|nr:retropepsin-like aspartic protease [uncultured Paraglaciecola sp.]
MKRPTFLLWLVLSASLTLNVFLLFNPNNQPLLSSVFDDSESALQNQVFAPLKSRNTNQTEDKTLQTPQVLTSSQVGQTQDNRLTLLSQAELWLQHKNFIRLGAFLQEYLQQHPQDMDFLLLEAKLKVETGLLSDAIAHYYDLLRAPMTAAQQGEIQLQIQQLSQTTIEQLRRSYSWDILAQFVEPLLQLEPNNRLYILSLAQAYAELFHPGLVENILGALEANDPDAQSIRKIILAQQSSPDNNEDAPQETSELASNIGRPIQLKKYGDQYVIDANLSSNPVSLLIDTGASVTAISTHYFENLSNRYKINYMGSFNMNTAAGRIMARMYQFRELAIGHVTVKNLPVVILPMENMENADGLLGMNFLREFDFKIDQNKSLIYIE